MRAGIAKMEKPKLDLTMGTFLKNNAVPSLVIFKDDELLTPEKSAAIRNQWQNIYGGKPGEQIKPDKPAVK